MYQEYIVGNESFGSVESFSAGGSPKLEESFLVDLGETCKRGHDVGSLFPKVTVEIDAADEGTHMSKFCRRGNVEDTLDLGGPWF